MGRERTRRAARLGMAAVLIGVAALTACTGGNTAVAQGDFKVACYKSTVWAGGPGVMVIPKLTPCSETAVPAVAAHVPLKKGGLVATGGSGQANVITNDACGTIYVFDNGGLATSPCTKDATVGTTACTKNTAAWKSTCSGWLRIETRSASITLQATWVGIDYASDLQVTLVTVFEGTAGVEAFTRVDEDAARQIDAFFGQEGELGAAELPLLDVERADAVAVEQGFAYFTAPENRLEDLAARTSFPARQPIPLALLPQLSVELDLRDRLDLILEQARLDGVDVAAFGLDGIVGPRSVILAAQGGPLADEKAQSALVDAIDWQQFEGLAAPGLAAEGLVALGSDGRVRDLRAVQYSPEAADAAVGLIGELRMRDLRIIVPERDATGLEALTTVLLAGDGRFPGLGRLVPGAEREGARDAEEARQRAADYAAKGIPSIVIYGLEG